MDTLILVDGSSYLFRAYHALPPLTTQSGKQSGAILGVINMLKKLMDEYPSPHLVMIFDAKGKNFRHQLFPDYKANRSRMPDDLAEQIDDLYALIRAMGIPLLSHSGVEADDVIGTLAVRGEQAGMDVLIVSGDKDMTQLINPAIHMLDTMKNKRFDPDGVEKKFGVAPNRIQDYLALMGDSADNIPGVPKVGPKTAVKWLKAYGSVEGVLAHKQDIGGKVGENLRTFEEQLKLSYELVRIRCDVELGVDLSSLVKQPMDYSAVLALCKMLEFNSWIRELERQETPTARQEEQPLSEVMLVNDEDSFANMYRQLEAADCLVFDTETTSLNTLQARCVGLSFALPSGESCYVPMLHQDDSVPQLDQTWVFAQLKPLFESPDKPKLAHHIKYDAHILANHGIHLAEPWYDSMLESYVQDTNGRHSLDSLSKQYLDYDTIRYEDLVPNKKTTFDQVSIDKASDYAGEDSAVCYRLHQFFSEKRLGDETRGELLTRLELPLVPILYRMERRGIKIDTALLQKQSESLGQRTSDLAEEIFSLSEERFNLDSPKQIQAVFYDKLHLPVLKKTPKGQPSTAEAVLQELALEHQAPALLLQYRRLNKLKSTYTDPLPKKVDDHTGRIHTSYHQAGTVTGRLSSSDPNLQNIPIRSAEGREIRQAFITEKNYRLVAADYSQIELRIMAHLSEDPHLLSAFERNQDVHRATAAELFEVDEETVSSEQRRRAKTVNFGLLYGMSAFGLAKQLAIPRQQAQSIVTQYFERFCGVKIFMDNIRTQAADQGYVETLLGRRLYLPEIRSKNGMRRQNAERAAINAPMQGTAAEIIKLAMIRVDEWLQEHAEIRAHLLMQVHDELVFEVHEEDLDALKIAIDECMTGALSLKVPLVVDIGVGNNWHEAH
jgi:DNA polymerase I